MRLGNLILEVTCQWKDRGKHEIQKLDGRHGPRKLGWRRGPWQKEPSVYLRQQGKIERDRETGRERGWRPFRSVSSEKQRTKTPESGSVSLLSPWEEAPGQSCSGRGPGMGDLPLLKEADAASSHGEPWRIPVSPHVALGSAPHVWPHATGEGCRPAPSSSVPRPAENWTWQPWQNGAAGAPPPPCIQRLSAPHTLPVPRHHLRKRFLGPT